MIGLEKGVVRLVNYNTGWKRLFQEEKDSLQAALGKSIIEIQHVGSTSIPGMVAKPIIDIAIAVMSFEEASKCIKPIERLGYEYKGENGIPRRHYFAKGNPRIYHIHMYEIRSLNWKNQLAFRDYLIKHTDVAQEYAELKLELAKEYPVDRIAHMNSKTHFIERILKLARSEIPRSENSENN